MKEQAERTNTEKQGETVKVATGPGARASHDDISHISVMGEARKDTNDIKQRKNL